MPSIKIRHPENAGICSRSVFSKTALVMLCTGLMACGGGSGTTRMNTDEETTPTPVTSINITAHMPMHIQNAILEVRVLGDEQPTYSNQDFTGFNALIDTLTIDHQHKLVWVKLSGNDQTTMYDPILNRYVPFKGTLNAILSIQDKMVINLTPASEAIFQRTLVRAGNLDLSQPDLSLVQAKHIDKSTSEINASLNNAFNVSSFPELSNSQSISLVSYNEGSSRAYLNTFLGLGLLNLWKIKQPDAQNTYLELAQNIAVDLRDGYLDGRSIVGDHTEFKALLNAPRNEAPEYNNLLDIGTRQQESRETFGAELKNATLAYATSDLALQQVRYPNGLLALQSYSYYTQENIINSTGRFRWNGAGDYRPAFGITTSAECQGVSINPCKQGLNADDIATNYSDIEYLIGTHTVGSCTVKMLPSGDVQLIRNSSIYTAQINRDLTDNLLQLDSASRHYLLNIGTGEIKPPYFIQLEIRDAQLINAKTGYSQNFYPLQGDIEVTSDQISSCI